MGQALDRKARLDLAVDDDLLAYEMRKVIGLPVELYRNQHPEFLGPEAIQCDEGRTERPAAVGSQHGLQHKCFGCPEACD